MAVAARRASSPAPVHRTVRRGNCVRLRQQRVRPGASAACVLGCWVCRAWTAGWRQVGMLARAGSVCNSGSQRRSSEALAISWRRRCATQTTARQLGSERIGKTMPIAVWHPHSLRRCLYQPPITRAMRPVAASRTVSVPTRPTAAGPSARWSARPCGSGNSPTL